MANAYPEWMRLEELLVFVQHKGIQRLSAADILEFGRLYRRAAAELSFHRTHEADPDRLGYLNDLVGRCYPYVYTAQRRPWPSVQRFFFADFPRAVRQHRLWILIAFLVSILPGAIGFGIAWQDRAMADQVLSAFMTSSDRVAERHHTRHDWLPAEERAEAASQIMTNNVQVTIFAFAGGMTAGLLTIFILIQNGLLLGVVAAVAGLDGAATAVNLWGFVAPHGVIELTAIFISGGAGFVLAYSMLNPGELPRRVALREGGKQALRLMLGVAAMLVVAGLIEGFFSPMNIPEGIKFTVAGVEAVLLLGYFVFAGRSATDVPQPTTALMTPLPPV